VKHAAPIMLAANATGSDIRTVRVDGKATCKRK
jgi:hypothetical protein